MTGLLITAAVFAALRIAYFHAEFSCRVWNGKYGNFYAIYWKRAHSFMVRRNPRAGWFMSRRTHISSIARIFELTEIVARGIILTIQELIDDEISTRQKGTDE